LKVLKVELGLDFWRASCLWRKRIETSFLDLKITHPQFVVLYHLKEFEDYLHSQKEIALATGIDAATLSQIVRLLEKKGLLKRKHAKDDERAKYLKLTPEGQKMLSQAIDKFHSANLSFFDPNLIDLAHFQKSLFILIK
jgi:DNA-binding MarR family transcriptional regulator